MRPGHRRLLGAPTAKAHRGMPRLRKPSLAAGASEAWGRCMLQQSASCGEPQHSAGRMEASGRQRGAFFGAQTAQGWTDAGSGKDVQRSATPEGAKTHPWLEFWGGTLCMGHLSAPHNSSDLKHCASPSQHGAVLQQECLACIISAIDFRQLLSTGKKLSGLTAARSGPTVRWTVSLFNVSFVHDLHAVYLPHKIPFFLQHF